MILKDNIINMIMMNNNLEIPALTFIFIQTLVNFTENDERNYLRSILILYKENIGLFFVNILNYRNVKELNENIDSLLRYISILMKNYKLGDLKNVRYLH
ncbi:hypothetical protein J6W34_03635 [bacterium]|nr:hypothetical protein [bacterium]